MPLLLEPGENLLMYGPTGGGKTTQLRKLIEAMATKERPARVYVTDRGGTLTILRPLVAKGLVQLEIYREGDRFIWINQAMQGNIYRDGKWVNGEPEKLCLIAFESLSGMGDLVINALGRQAAEGHNVGGEPAPGLRIQAQGQDIMVPASSRTHYLVAQRHLLEEVWNSQLLPVPVVWTAHEDIVPLDKKAPDGEKTVETVAGLGIRGLIGPLVVGSALTRELAKYFVFTFRLSQRVTDSGKTHIMFTGRHKDGNLEGLANARTPMNSKVPLKVEPTDVVRVLQMIKTELSA